VYPQAIEVDLQGSNLSELDFIGVKMGDPSGGANPLNLTDTSPELTRTPNQLRFSAGQEPPARDTPWEVDIRAFQFSEMVAAQFSMSWDPAKVSFLGVTNLNEELGLTLAENFATDSATEGALPWLWFAGNGPVTIADSTVLFTLRFEVTGETGDSLEFAFTEVPTNFYFEDADGEVAASLEDRTYVLVQSTSTRGTDPFAGMMLYPNPTTGEVVVKYDRYSRLHLSLLDTRGKMIRNWPAYRTGTTLNVRDVAAGVYLLRIQNENGVGVRRLIIRD